MLNENISDSGRFIALFNEWRECTIYLCRQLTKNVGMVLLSMGQVFIFRNPKMYH